MKISLLCLVLISILVLSGCTSTAPQEKEVSATNLDSPLKTSFPQRFFVNV